MKRIIFCLMVSTATTAVYAAAKTWYVDDDNYNDSYTTAAEYISAGFDGTTPERGFGTIQIAIDKASAGDTILVCPGVYDKGGKMFTVQDTDYGFTRVVIGKSLTIESTGGAAVTHIVGNHGNVADGTGDGAVRCVGQSWATSTLKGFTIRDGATAAEVSDTAKGRAGAVYTQRGASPTYVVDCVISNCASYCTTLRNGVFIRTLVCDNYTVGFGAAGGEAMFYSCIITRNRSGNSLVSGGYNSMEHCTVFGNATYTSVSAMTVAKNNIIALSYSSSSASDLSGTTLANNVLGAVDGIYQTIAPAAGNFRVLSGSVADLNRVDGADGSDMYRAIPEEYRNKDFYGNTIPAENALPGAVQEVVAAAGGALQFTELSSSAAVCVNGWKSIKSGAYVFPTNYPVQYLVSPALSSGRFYAWTTSSDHGGFHIPDWKTDTIYMMPPPSSSVVMTNTLKLAAGEVWLDPDDGDDDNGDGTESNPYQTLQKGYSTAAAYSFVYCKAGSYNKGGEAQYGKNRLYTHDRSLRFVGVDGAANTFIVGEADTSNPVPSEPGCGPNAMRGLYVGSGTTGFEGFTFRDCHASSSADGTDTTRQGGIMRTTSNNVTIQDCIIESSCSSATHAFTGGRLVRCHFKGLASGVPAYSLARLSGCLIENCPASDWPGGEGYNCTLRNSGILGRNYMCIASGKLTSTAFASGHSRHAGGLYWGFTGTVPSGTGYTVGRPRFVSSHGAEIRRISPAFTCGEVPTAANFGADYYKHVCTDFFGNPIAFTAGKPVVGADQIGTEGVPGVILMVK